MYKTSTELIESELPKNVVEPLYTIFEDAYIIGKDVLGNEFYDSAFTSNIKGRIMSYAINRQFDPEYLPRNFTFDVNVVTMPFNQKRVELRNRNILLTIGKANNNELPVKSAYKKEFSSRNWGLGNQIYMDFVEDYSISLQTEPYYGIITYKINDDGFEFVDIVIPDCKYSKVLNKMELKPRFKVYRKEDIKNDKERILSIENIKKDIVGRLPDLSEGEK